MNDLADPAPLEHLRDRSSAAEARRRELRVARHVRTPRALDRETGHVARRRRTRGRAEVTLEERPGITKAVPLEEPSIDGRHRRHEHLECGCLLEAVVVAKHRVDRALGRRRERAVATHVIEHSLLAPRRETEHAAAPHDPERMPLLEGRIAEHVRA
jgi:hypothetical protein